MPKYYRFRATTPSRKPKRKNREWEGILEKPKSEPERSWLDVVISCAAAPSWYLRRTSWRMSSPLAGIPKQLAGLGTSLNRIYVFKTPFKSGVGNDQQM